MGFDIAALGPVESSSYHNLRATHHKDPFERMLIWQAICNDYTFVSSDSHVKKYTSEGLRILVT
jgi:PIN domain nuclease of toxin-antitoxin system